jgi:DNA mismatch repair protein MutS2
VAAIREGELQISAGAMTIRAAASDVEVVSAAEARRHERGREGGRKPSRREPAVQEAAAGPSNEDALQDAIRMSSNTLDLRGARVAEGLARLEEFLDESMLANRDTIFVLHGHGTGAMRSAVRRALSSSKYVAASAPASEEQGGDALTVARLRD